jgi:hypothetical protein
LNLYTAAADILDHTVSANVFSNGTGDVALTMPTLYLGPHWECVVKDSIQVTNKIPDDVSDEHH